MSTPKAAPAQQTRRRLERLRDLVERRADPHWGIDEIRAILPRDPADPATRCPRYAGVVAESGDERILVGEDPGELAGEMASLAASETPISPVELIDLDTGESHAAILETAVWFDGDEPPAPPGQARTVVLLAIHHRRGTDYQLARDEPHARELIHAWVARWWGDERSARRPLLGAMPSDPDEAQDRYFTEVEDEWAETATLELPDGTATRPGATAGPCAEEST